MRTRLRLGAAAAVGLGALLLATALASPALAWHSEVSVDADCYEDHIRATYTVTSWKEGAEADVDVFYKINGGEKQQLPSGEFTEESSSFEGYVDLPAGTTGEIEVFAVAHWKGTTEKPTKDSGTDDLPAEDECKDDTTTSSQTTAPPTTAPPTTAPPTTVSPTTAPPTTVSPTTAPPTTVSPTTSLETTTTEAGAGGVTTTTTGGGQLPFTGASSGPMLLAGIALVGGGAVVLLVSRIRDRHAA